MNEHIKKFTRCRNINKVDFPYKDHKAMWDILSRWKGKYSLDETKVAEAIIRKKRDALKQLGYKNFIPGSCLACDANATFRLNNLNKKTVIGAYSCDSCPIGWTNNIGVPVCTCHQIYEMWENRNGKQKQELAKMIRDMPLKEGIEKLYNIIE